MSSLASVFPLPCDLSKALQWPCLDMILQFCLRSSCCSWWFVLLTLALRGRGRSNGISSRLSCSVCRVSFRLARLRSYREQLLSFASASYDFVVMSTRVFSILFWMGWLFWLLNQHCFPRIIPVWSIQCVLFNEDFMFVFIKDLGL